MVYCPRCGNQNDDSAQFCIKCGQSLAVRPETVGPPPAPPPGRKRAPGGTLLIALLALVAVAATVGGVFWLTRQLKSGGEWIAYLTEDSDGELSQWVARPDGGARVEVVSRVDEIRYTSVPEGELRYRYTPFAPKGDRMLFIVVDGDELSLYTYALGEDEAERIVYRVEDMWFEFSPDGDRIGVDAYEDGEGRVLLVDNDGENQVSLLNRVPGWIWLDWLPNGRQLGLILEDEGGYSLLITDEQGDEQFTIVNQMDEVSYVVSSEGDRLAYAVEDRGSWDVYIANVDGSDSIRLAGGLAEASLLGFAPDGEQLLMQASTDGYLYDLYLMESDGTSRVTLAHDVQDVDGGFCPGGKQIRFMVWEGGTGRLSLAGADGEDVILVGRQITDWDKDFTPDGSTMIVGLKRAGNWDLYAVDVATGEQVSLLTNADALGLLVPVDDNRVLFSAREGDNWTLYVAHLDGDDIVALAGPADGFGGYDASPDGRRVVYSEERLGVNRLYVIDIDGENREKLADDGIWPHWSD